MPNPSARSEQTKGSQTKTQFPLTQITNAATPINILKKTNVSKSPDPIARSKEARIDNISNIHSSHTSATSPTRVQSDSAEDTSPHITDSTTQTITLPLPGSDTANPRSSSIVPLTTDSVYSATPKTVKMAERKNVSFSNQHQSDFHPKNGKDGYEPFSLVSVDTADLHAVENDANKARSAVQRNSPANHQGKNRQTSDPNSHQTPRIASSNRTSASAHTAPRSTGQSPHRDRNRKFEEVILSNRSMTDDQNYNKYQRLNQPFLSHSSNPHTLASQSRGADALPKQTQSQTIARTSDHYDEEDEPVSHDFKRQRRPMPFQQHTDISLDLQPTAISSPHLSRPKQTQPTHTSPLTQLTSPPLRFQSADLTPAYSSPFKSSQTALPPPNSDAILRFQQAKQHDNSHEFKNNNTESNNNSASKRKNTDHQHQQYQSQNQTNLPPLPQYSFLISPSQDPSSNRQRTRAVLRSSEIFDLEDFSDEQGDNDHDQNDDFLQQLRHLDHGILSQEIEVLLAPKPSSKVISPAYKTNSNHQDSYLTSTTKPLQKPAHTNRKYTPQMTQELVNIKITSSSSQQQQQQVLFSPGVQSKLKNRTTTMIYKPSAHTFSSQDHDDNNRHEDLDDDDDDDDDDDANNDSFNLTNVFTQESQDYGHHSPSEKRRAHPSRLVPLPLLAPPPPRAIPQTNSSRTSNKLNAPRGLRLQIETPRARGEGDSPTKYTNDRTAPPLLTFQQLFSNLPKTSKLTAFFAESQRNSVSPMLSTFQMDQPPLKASMSFFFEPENGPTTPSLASLLSPKTNSSLFRPNPGFDIKKTGLTRNIPPHLLNWFPNSFHQALPRPFLDTHLTLKHLLHIQHAQSYLNCNIFPNGAQFPIPLHQISLIPNNNILSASTSTPSSSFSHNPRSTITPSPFLLPTDFSPPNQSPTSSSPLLDHHLNNTLTLPIPNPFFQQQSDLTPVQTTLSNQINLAFNNFILTVLSLYTKYSSNYFYTDSSRDGNGNKLPFHNIIPNNIHTLLQFLSPTALPLPSLSSNHSTDDFLTDFQSKVQSQQQHNSTSSATTLPPVKDIPQWDEETTFNQRAPMSQFDALPSLTQPQSDGSELIIPQLTSTATTAGNQAPSTRPRSYPTPLRRENGSQNEQTANQQPHFDAGTFHVSLPKVHNNSRYTYDTLLQASLLDLNQNRNQLCFNVFVTHYHLLDLFFHTVYTNILTPFFTTPFLMAPKFNNMLARGQQQQQQQQQQQLFNNQHKTLHTNLNPKTTLYHTNIDVYLSIYNLLSPLLFKHRSAGALCTNLHSATPSFTRSVKKNEEKKRSPLENPHIARRRSTQHLFGQVYSEDSFIWNCYPDLQQTWLSRFMQILTSNPVDYYLPITTTFEQNSSSLPLFDLSFDGKYVDRIVTILQFYKEMLALERALKLDLNTHHHRQRLENQNQLIVSVNRRRSKQFRTTADLISNPTDSSSIPPHHSVSTPPSSDLFLYSAHDGTQSQPATRFDTHQSLPNDYPQPLLPHTSSNPTNLNSNLRNTQSDDIAYKEHLLTQLSRVLGYISPLISIDLDTQEPFALFFYTIEAYHASPDYSNTDFTLYRPTPTPFVQSPHGLTSPFDLESFKMNASLRVDSSPSTTTTTSKHQLHEPTSIMLFNYAVKIQANESISGTFLQSFPLTLSPLPPPLPASQHGFLTTSASVDRAGVIVDQHDTFKEWSQQLTSNSSQTISTTPTDDHHQHNSSSYILPARFDSNRISSLSTSESTTQLAQLLPAPHPVQPTPLKSPAGKMHPTNSLSLKSSVRVEEIEIPHQPPPTLFQTNPTLSQHHHLLLARLYHAHRQLTLHPWDVYEQYDALLEPTQQHPSSNANSLNHSQPPVVTSSFNISSLLPDFTIPPPQSTSTQPQQPQQQSLSALYSPESIIETAQHQNAVSEISLFQSLHQNDISMFTHLFPLIIFHQSWPASIIHQDMPIIQKLNAQTPESFDLRYQKSGEYLGNGTFGTVSLIHDRVTSTPLVLKEVPCTGTSYAPVTTKIGQSNAQDFTGIDVFPQKLGNPTSKLPPRPPNPRNAPRGKVNPSLQNDQLMKKNKQTQITKDTHYASLRLIYREFYLPQYIHHIFQLRQSRFLNDFHTILFPSSNNSPLDIHAIPQLTHLQQQPNQSVKMDWEKFIIKPMTYYFHPQCDKYGMLYEYCPYGTITKQFLQKKLFDWQLTGDLLNQVSVVQMHQDRLFEIDQKKHVIVGGTQNTTHGTQLFGKSYGRRVDAPKLGTIECYNNEHAVALLLSRDIITQQFSNYMFPTRKPTQTKQSKGSAVRYVYNNSAFSDPISPATSSKRFQSNNSTSSTKRQSQQQQQQQQQQHTIPDISPIKILHGSLHDIDTSSLPKSTRSQRSSLEPASNKTNPKNEEVHIVQAQSASFVQQTSIIHLPRPTMHHSDDSPMNSDSDQFYNQLNLIDPGYPSLLPDPLDSTLKSHKDEHFRTNLQPQSNSILQYADWYHYQHEKWLSDGEPLQSIPFFSTEHPNHAVVDKNISIRDYPHPSTIPLTPSVGFCTFSTLAILQQLAQGLATMHLSNVVHMDLKLDNILISPSDTWVEKQDNNKSIQDIMLSQQLILQPNMIQKPFFTQSQHILALHVQAGVSFDVESTLLQQLMVSLETKLQTFTNSLRSVNSDPINAQDVDLYNTMHDDDDDDDNIIPHTNSHVGTSPPIITHRPTQHLPQPSNAQLSQHTTMLGTPRTSKKSSFVKNKIHTQQLAQQSQSQSDKLELIPLQDSQIIAHDEDGDAIYSVEPSTQRQIASTHLQSQPTRNLSSHKTLHLAAADNSARNSSGLGKSSNSFNFNQIQSIFTPTRNYTLTNPYASLSPNSTLERLQDMDLEEQVQLLMKLVNQRGYQPHQSSQSYLSSLRLSSSPPTSPQHHFNHGVVNDINSALTSLHNNQRTSHRSSLAPSTSTTSSQHQPLFHFDKLQFVDNLLSAQIRQVTDPDQIYFPLASPLPSSNFLISQPQSQTSTISPPYNQHSFPHFPRSTVDFTTLLEQHTPIYFKLGDFGHSLMYDTRNTLTSRIKMALNLRFYNVINEINSFIYQYRTLQSNLNEIVTKLSTFKPNQHELSTNGSSSGLTGTPKTSSSPLSSRNPSNTIGSNNTFFHSMLSLFPCVSDFQLLGSLYHHAVDAVERFKTTKNPYLDLVQQNTHQMTTLLSSLTALYSTNTTSQPSSPAQPADSPSIPHGSHQFDANHFQSLLAFHPPPTISHPDILSDAGALFNAFDAIHQQQFTPQHLILHSTYLSALCSLLQSIHQAPFQLIFQLHSIYTHVTMLKCESFLANLDLSAYLIAPRLFSTLSKPRSPQSPTTLFSIFALPPAHSHKYSIKFPITSLIPLPTPFVSLFSNFSTLFLNSKDCTEGDKFFLCPKLLENSGGLSTQRVQYYSQSTQTSHPAHSQKPIQTSTSLEHLFRLQSPSTNSSFNAGGVDNDNGHTSRHFNRPAKSRDDLIQQTNKTELLNDISNIHDSLCYSILPFHHGAQCIPTNALRPSTRSTTPSLIKFPFFASVQSLNPHLTSSHGVSDCLQEYSNPLSVQSLFPPTLSLDSSDIFSLGLSTLSLYNQKELPDTSDHYLRLRSDQLYRWLTSEEVLTSGLTNPVHPQPQPSHPSPSPFTFSPTPLAVAQIPSNELPIIFPQANLPMFACNNNSRQNYLGIHQVPLATYSQSIKPTPILPSDVSPTNRAVVSTLNSMYTVISPHFFDSFSTQLDQFISTLNSRKTAVSNNACSLNSTPTTQDSNPKVTKNKKKAGSKKVSPTPPRPKTRVNILPVCPVELKSLYSGLLRNQQHLSLLPSAQLLTLLANIDALPSTTYSSNQVLDLSHTPLLDNPFLHPIFAHLLNLTSSQFNPQSAQFPSTLNNAASRLPFNQPILTPTPMYTDISTSPVNTAYLDTFALSTRRDNQCTCSSFTQHNNKPILNFIKQLITTHHHMTHTPPHYFGHPALTDSSFSDTPTHDVNHNDTQPVDQNNFSSSQHQQLWSPSFSQTSLNIPHLSTQSSLIRSPSLFSPTLQATFSFSLPSIHLVKPMQGQNKWNIPNPLNKLLEPVNIIHFKQTYRQSITFIPPKITFNDYLRKALLDAKENMNKSNRATSNPTQTRTHPKQHKLLGTTDTTELTVPIPTPQLPTYPCLLASVSRSMCNSTDVLNKNSAHPSHNADQLFSFDLSNNLITYQFHNIYEPIYASGLLKRVPFYSNNTEQASGVLSAPDSQLFDYIAQIFFGTQSNYANPLECDSVTLFPDRCSGQTEGSTSSTHDVTNPTPFRSNDIMTQYNKQFNNQHPITQPLSSIQLSLTSHVISQTINVYLVPYLHYIIQSMCSSDSLFSQGDTTYPTELPPISNHLHHQPPTMPSLDTTMLSDQFPAHNDNILTLDDLNSSNLPIDAVSRRSSLNFSTAMQQQQQQPPQQQYLHKQPATTATPAKSAIPQLPASSSISHLFGDQNDDFNMSFDDLLTDFNLSSPIKPPQDTTTLSISSIPTSTTSLLPLKPPSQTNVSHNAYLSFNSLLSNAPQLAFSSSLFSAPIESSFIASDERDHSASSDNLSFAPSNSVRTPQKAPMPRPGKPHQLFRSKISQTTFIETRPNAYQIAQSLSATLSSTLSYSHTIVQFVQVLIKTQQIVLVNYWDIVQTQGDHCLSHYADQFTFEQSLLQTSSAPLSAPTSSPNPSFGEEMNDRETNNSTPPTEPLQSTNITNAPSLPGVLVTLPQDSSLIPYTKVTWVPGIQIYSQSQENSIVGDCPCPQTLPICMNCRPHSNTAHFNCSELISNAYREAIDTFSPDCGTKLDITPPPSPLSLHSPLSSPTPSMCSLCKVDTTGRTDSCKFTTYPRHLNSHHHNLSKSRPIPSLSEPQSGILISLPQSIINSPSASACEDPLSTVVLNPHQVLAHLLRSQCYQLNTFTTSTNSTTTTQLSHLFNLPFISQFPRQQQTTLLSPLHTQPATTPFTLDPLGFSLFHNILHHLATSATQLQNQFTDLISPLFALPSHFIQSKRKPLFVWIAPQKSL